LGAADRILRSATVVDAALRVRQLRAEWRRLADNPLDDPALMDAFDDCDRKLTAAITDFNTALAALAAPEDR
jgi:hypothetical protein